MGIKKLPSGNRGFAAPSARCARGRSRSGVGVGDVALCLRVGGVVDVLVAADERRTLGVPGAVHPEGGERLGGGVEGVGLAGDAPHAAVQVGHGADDPAGGLDHHVPSGVVGDDDLLLAAVGAVVDVADAAGVECRAGARGVRDEQGGQRGDQGEHELQHLDVLLRRLLLSVDSETYHNINKQSSQVI